MGVFMQVCEYTNLSECTHFCLLCTHYNLQRSKYSKASRYVASSCTDLAGARFWIGSKKIWDERIYVVKPWGARFFDHLAFTLLSNKSCTNFELHEFFLSPKKRASQGLTVDAGQHIKNMALVLKSYLKVNNYKFGSFWHWNTFLKLEKNNFWTINILHLFRA